jgi:hypothetical protein
MSRRFRLAIMVASLCAMLALTSFTVTAQTPTSPALSVAANTQTPFVGSGFHAGEIIALWMTAPDQTTTPLDRITADASGGFSVNVSFPTTGVWHVTAHGQSSGVEVIGTFGVGVTPPQSPPATTPGIPGAALPASGSDTTLLPATTTYPQVALNAPVVFSGSGLIANEPLSFWETAPTGTATAISGVQTADQNGSFTTSIPFTTAGFWQVTAHGITSGHEVIGRYMVGDTTTAPPAPIAPVNTTDSPGTSVAATVGLPVSFTASGFTPGEHVSAWVTAPASTVTPLNQATADHTGSVVITTSFATAGLWQVTAHGVDSAHEVVGQYQVA